MLLECCQMLPLIGTGDLLIRHPFTDVDVNLVTKVMDMPHGRVFNFSGYQKVR
jgi:hypothetical protein